MQALNLEIVDLFIEEQETSLLTEYMEKEKTPAWTLFVSVLSQLWIFGLYELLRTWRQRASDFLGFTAELQTLTPAKQRERINLQKTRMHKAAEAALGFGQWPTFRKGLRSKRLMKNIAEVREGPG